MGASEDYETETAEESAGHTFNSIWDYLRLEPERNAFIWISSGFVTASGGKVKWGSGKLIVCTEARYCVGEGVRVQIDDIGPWGGCSERDL